MTSDLFTSVYLGQNSTKMERWNGAGHDVTDTASSAARFTPPSRRLYTSRDLGREQANARLRQVSWRVRVLRGVRVCARGDCVCVPVVTQWRTLRTRACPL